MDCSLILSKWRMGKEETCKFRFDKLNVRGNNNSTNKQITTKQQKYGHI